MNIFCFITKNIAGGTVEENEPNGNCILLLFDISKFAKCHEHAGIMIRNQRKDSMESGETKM